MQSQVEQHVPHTGTYKSTLWHPASAFLHSRSAKLSKNLQRSLYGVLEKNATSAPCVRFSDVLTSTKFVPMASVWLDHRIDMCFIRTTSTPSDLARKTASMALHESEAEVFLRTIISITQSRRSKKRCIYGDAVKCLAVKK
jgi:hypothetical protein